MKADPCDLSPLLTLRHRVGQRCRFTFEADGFEALHGLSAGWSGVLSQRLSRWSRSLVVTLEEGIDPLAWASLQDQARRGQAPLLAVTTAAPLDDDSQDEIAAALASTRLELLPPRLRLPALALGATLLAIPLELPALPLLVLVLLASGRCFARAGTSLVRDRQLNVDVLDALAVVLHSIEGFLLGPALMLTMIEGGESIRDATARIAHASARNLKADLSRQVSVRRGDALLSLPLAEVRSGDLALVFAGDQVPVDGIVALGQASLDVRSLTGESVPREVEIGEEVLASSVLLEGYLEIITTAVGDDTRAGQIARLIEAAPVCDSRVGNVAARVANRFVLPTLGLSAFSYALSGSLSQTASLLMFDLGTGLRVSVPTAILASLNRAAAHGILIRSGRVLEALAEVDVVVFDKTGTLTTGEPALLEIELLDNRFEADQLLQLAASAEQGLNHPIALAITAAAERRGLATLPVDDWQCQIGRGVRARQAGRQVLVGNRRLLREEGLDPPPTSRDPRLRVATPILVAIDGRVVGILYVADRLRPDSRELLHQLRQRGIDSHILTGDVEAVALQVGQELGLPRSRIHAEALPDIKAEVVRRLKAEGKRVAFVGDGLNDSAALAYADVAVSFRHGSDLARETADIVLCGERISQLLDAQALARFSFAVVRQNIGVVAVPNLTALLLGVLLPIPPLLAILINNGTCIVAALNALRPLRYPFSEAPLAAAEVGQPAPVLAPPPVSLAPPVPAAPAVPARLGAAVVSSPVAMPLAPSQLARRLKVSTQRLVARRRRDDFQSWSAQLDPQRLSWRYEPGDQRFHPVAVAVFEHDAA